MKMGQILVDRYEAQAEQFCWRSDWLLHGESAWTLFWKFGLLNQLTGRELLELVVRKSATRRLANCAKPNVDLRDMGVFDADALGRLFRVSPARVRTAFLFENLPGSVLRSSEHLRWCVECMSRGFHSPLYQMRLTTNCPIHNSPMVENCNRCGRKIPYRLTSAYLQKPFHCPCCGASFAPTMGEERPEPMRMRQDYISRLSWLLKLHRSADADLISVSDAERIMASAKDAGIAFTNLNELDIHSRYASFISQVLDSVTPGRIQHQRGLKLEPITRIESGTWRPVAGDSVACEREDDDGAPEPHALTASEVGFAAVLSTYRAVRRHLWRRVLRRHQQCIHCTASRLWWHMDGERTSGFCPDALAFIRWRMLWEGVGTPRYLLASQSKEYFGVLGWHLARPSPAPDHWSIATKAWVESHMFRAACTASFNDMLAWARSMYEQDRFTWDRPKSPVNYTTLWAVAGCDCRERPAEIYVPSSPLMPATAVRGSAAEHRRRLDIEISRLSR